ATDDCSQKPAIGCPRIQCHVASRAAADRFSGEPGTIGDRYDRSFERDIARAAGACCVDIAAGYDGDRVVGLQINVDAVRADAGRKTIVAPGAVWQGTADIKIIWVHQQRTVAAVLGTQIEAEANGPRQ